MADAFSHWNGTGDACAISIDRRPNDLPLDPINDALATFYSDGEHQPYIYCVYEGDRFTGLLVAGNFNPESDEEITAVFRGAIDYSNTVGWTDDDPHRPKSWRV